MDFSFSNFFQRQKKATRGTTAPYYTHDLLAKTNYVDSILQVRQSGRTTKLANFFATQLLVMGEAFPVDHYPTPEAWSNLVLEIIRIIEGQHPLLKGCIEPGIRDVSIKIDKDAYLRNVENHLSNRL